MTSRSTESDTKSSSREGRGGEKLSLICYQTEYRNTPKNIYTNEALKALFTQNQYFNMKKRFPTLISISFCDSIFSMKNPFTRSMHSIYFYPLSASQQEQQQLSHFREDRLKLLSEAMIRRVNLYLKRMAKNIDKKSCVVCRVVVDCEVSMGFSSTG